MLGVDRSASDASIKEAYKRLVRAHHPDNGGDEELFKDINTAYQTLSDPDRRREHDARRAHTPPSGFDVGGFTSAGFHTNAHDFTDLFADLFTAVPPTPRVVRAKIELSLADALHGATVTLNIDGLGPLHTHIPPGVTDGATLRIPAPEDLHYPDGAPIEVRLTVTVAPHPIFVRRSIRDIEVELPLGVIEATVGTEVQVPGWSKPYTLRIPAGTQHGAVLRVSGAGPRVGDRVGDLYVRIALMVPVSLPDHDLRKLRDLHHIDAAPGHERSRKYRAQNYQSQ